MRRILTSLMLAALIIGSAGPAFAGLRYALKVDGLACPFCAYGVEKQLGRIDGVAALKTEIASGTVLVTMTDGATLEESRAKQAVEAAGFTLRDFEALGDSGEGPGK